MLVARYGDGRDRRREPTSFLFAQGYNKLGGEISHGLVDVIIVMPKRLLDLLSCDLG